MKFYLKPNIYCPLCFLCLLYEAGPNDVRLVAHPSGYGDCEYEGRKFKAPEIELEPA